MIPILMLEWRIPLWSKISISSQKVSGVVRIYGKTVKNDKRLVPKKSK